MLNLQTGEITLPEITLHPDSTLKDVLAVLGTQVKVDPWYRKTEWEGEEQELACTWLYFTAPPVVADNFTLEALQFDAYGTLQQYQLSPSDIGDDEYGDEYRAPVEARLAKMVYQNNGVTTANYKPDVRYETLNGRWQFYWGAIAYDDDHFVEIYLRHRKQNVVVCENGVNCIYRTDEIDANGKVLPGSIEQRLLREFNKLGFLPPLNSLYYGPGFLVNLTVFLPNGTPVQFWDDEGEYYIAQVPSTRDKCFGLVGDEHHLVVYEYAKDGTDPELIMYKKWN